MRPHHGQGMCRAPAPADHLRGVLSPQNEAVYTAQEWWGQDGDGAHVAPQRKDPAGRAISSFRKKMNSHWISSLQNPGRGTECENHV